MSPYYLPSLYSINIGRGLSGQSKTRRKTNKNSNLEGAKWVNGLWSKRKGILPGKKASPSLFVLDARKSNVFCHECLEWQWLTNTCRGSKPKKASWFELRKEIQSDQSIPVFILEKRNGNQRGSRFNLTSIRRRMFSSNPGMKWKSIERKPRLPSTAEYPRLRK